VDIGKFYAFFCIYNTDTWLGYKSFWTFCEYLVIFTYFLIPNIISATIPVIGVYVLNTKLQFPEMYIGIAVAALGIFEKVGLAYSVHRWQFYTIKTVGYSVYISQSLVRSQLSKVIPPEDLCKYKLLLSYFYI